MKKTLPLPTTAFAACTFEIQADGAAIQLFPAGAFKARDGRPTDVASGHWFIDAAVADRVIAKAATRLTDTVIDYEHQTLNSALNGEPAPAAGWFAGTALEWREGLGLFATPVTWTEKATGFIQAKEYRYLSPVFSYSTTTGEVLDLLHVALTNFPALDGMDDLPALAAARFDMAAPAAPSTEEKHRVNKEALIALLNLTSEASDEDIQTALNGLKSDAGKVQELTDALAAAKSAVPDPSKYISIDVVEAIKSDVAALKTTQVTSEVEQLVQAGLSDGRLLAQQEGWARDLGTSNIAQLKGYLDKTPAIAALKGRQTEGKNHLVPATTEELGSEALAICKSMGIAPADYLATLKGES